MTSFSFSLFQFSLLVHVLSNTSVILHAFIIQTVKVKGTLDPSYKQMHLQLPLHLSLMHLISDALRHNPHTNICDI